MSEMAEVGSESADREIVAFGAIELRHQTLARFAEDVQR